MAKSSGQTQRALFPGHNVNGKGSKNRTVETDGYRQALDDINWHRDQDDGFRREGNRLIKRYGIAEVTPLEQGPHIKVL